MKPLRFEYVLGKVCLFSCSQMTWLQHLIHHKYNIWTILKHQGASSEVGIEKAALAQ